MDQKDSQTNDSELWVDKYGDILYRYALSRLYNHAASEDVVQETFLAAIRAEQGFSGRSSIRTWLIGILKHKIVDLIRKESREQGLEDIEAIDSQEEVFFDRKGRWRAAPADWQINPGKMLEQKEFMDVLTRCLEHLPDRLRRIFVLRELENQKTEEICKDLAISATNLWVMLYRGRMRLRNCLSKNWFDATDKEGESC